MRTPRYIILMLTFLPALLVMACTISSLSPAVLPTLAPQVPGAATTTTTPVQPQEDQIPDRLPASTAEVAGTLAPGETVTGTLLQDSATVWMLQGDAGEMFDVVAEPTDAGLDLLLDVLDENHRTILPTGEVDHASGTEAIYGLVLPAAGEYRIQLRGFLGSGGNYSLAVHPAGHVIGTLTTGQLITNTLTAGETQVYSLEGTAGISLTVLVATATGLDVAVEVLDTDHRLATSANSGGAGEGEVFSFLPAGDGPYRVRVRELSGSGGTYTLAMVAEDSAQLAPRGVVNAGEQAVYTVTVPAGESSLVGAVPSESFDVLVTVLDAQGNTL